MRFAVALCLLALCGSASAVDYNYTARTAEPVRVSGSVRVSSYVWNCRDRACTITGPWYEPGIGACRILAQKVGRIISYGHPGRQLNGAQIAECNSDSTTSPSTVDVPPISAPVNTVIKGPRKDLPPPSVDGRKLVHALGPQIQEFQATDGCRYPGRGDSLGFSYRVVAAPDGAALAIVEILQVLADGATRTVFVSPGDDGRSVQFAAAKIVDHGAAADVVRYMLRATDVRRRQASSVIPSPYWAGQSALRIGPRFTVRRDGTQFLYMVPYTMENLAPASAPVPSITFRRDGPAIRADIVGGGSMSTIHSDGVEGWLSSHGRNFYSESRGHISFRARQAVWPDGRLEMPSLSASTVATIDGWSMNIRIARAGPSGCGGSLGFVSATLAGDAGQPPPPAATAEFTGYQWSIPCACEEPYDDDITRTRAFTSVIQACMANERGGALMCALSAPQLNPTNAAGRHCTARGLATRVDSGPMSCFAVPGSIRILENNR